MTKEEFATQIKKIKEQERNKGKECIDINAGDIHRAVGGYPGRNHRMATCCDAMYDLMSVQDNVLKAPTKGKGASLTIRYYL